MKPVTLTEAQLDTLVIAAHSMMDGRLPADEEAVLEGAVDALLEAADTPRVSAPPALPAHAA